MRGGWNIRIGLWVMIGCLTACTLDDERDICCYNVELDYRYCRDGAEQDLDVYVSTFRHFLFDAEGILQEVFDVSGDDCERQRLVLPSGNYTMVSFANQKPGQSAYSPFTVGTTTLEEMRIYKDYPQEDGFHADCEPLFYAYRPFTVKRSGASHYIADVTHAHNELTIIVKWKNGNIPASESYRMELTGVPAEYSFDPGDFVTIGASSENSEMNGSPVSTANRLVYAMPQHAGRMANHAVQARFKPNGSLEGVFTTYRYTNATIPLFRLYGDNGPLMKQIDLATFFYRMGWELDRNLEQVFSITLTIDGDRVYASPTYVNDWEDGGVIGAGSI